jgi:hypothetical protein
MAYGELNALAAMRSANLRKLAGQISAVVPGPGLRPYANRTILVTFRHAGVGELCGLVSEWVCYEPENLVMHELAAGAITTWGTVFRAACSTPASAVDMWICAVWLPAQARQAVLVTVDIAAAVVDGHYHRTLKRLPDWGTHLLHSGPSRRHCHDVRTGRIQVGLQRPLSPQRPTHGSRRANDHNHERTRQCSRKTLGELASSPFHSATIASSARRTNYGRPGMDRVRQMVRCARMRAAHEGLVPAASC